ncbi:hypothetical protein BST61_g4443 [Cercospora zeina]
MATSIADEKRRELPSQATLDEVGEINIKDKDGKEVPFKSLYTGKPANERQLVIFIRHFFCGSCEQYIEALAKDLPPAKLSAANTTLTVIGSGEPLLIESYAKRTGSPYQIYTDNSVQLYKKFGMVSTLKGSTGASKYMHKGFFKNAIDSTWNGIMSGHPLSSGPPAQNGGELLFQDGQLKWCSRMRDSTDHSEVDELKEVLGIKE